MGTPEYMSPEQHDGHHRRCVERSVQLLRLPLGGLPRTTAAARKACEGSRRRRAATALRRRREARPRSCVPRRVRAALARGLSERPQDRYPSMEALLVDLRLARHPPRPMWPIVARRRRARRGGAFRIPRCARATDHPLPRRARQDDAPSGTPGGATPCAGVLWRAACLTPSTRSAPSRPRSIATRRIGRRVTPRLARTRGCAASNRRTCSIAAWRASSSAVSSSVRKWTCSRAPTAPPSKKRRKPRSRWRPSAIAPIARGSRRGSCRPIPRRVPRSSASWQELGRAKALFESGRYAEGEPVARAVAEQATALRYRPLEADAELTLAQLLDAKGEYTPAEATLRQALRAAQAGGVQDVAARAWIGLVKVVGVRQQHHAEAHEWALDAEAHLESAHASDATLGLLLSAESDLFYQEGKYEQGRRNRAKSAQCSGAHARSGGRRRWRKC